MSTKVKQNGQIRRLWIEVGTEVGQTSWDTEEQFDRQTPSQFIGGRDR